MLMMWLIFHTRPDHYVADWVEARAGAGSKAMADTSLAAVLGNLLPACFLFVVSTVAFGFYNTLLGLPTPLSDWWNTHDSNAYAGNCGGAHISHCPEASSAFCPRYPNMCEVMGRAGFVIVASLIATLWWILTCIFVLFVAKTQSLSKLQQHWQHKVWILQYVGGCIFYSAAMDVFLLTIVLMPVLVLAHLQFFVDIDIWMYVDRWSVTVGFCLILAIDVIILLVVPKWTVLIRKHFPEFKRRWLMAMGLVWAGVLAGPIWLYLLIVRGGYTAIAQENTINQNAIVIWAFVLALNGATFAMVKKLYEHVIKE